MKAITRYTPAIEMTHYLSVTAKANSFPESIQVIYTLLDEATGVPIGPGPRFPPGPWKWVLNQVRDKSQLDHVEAALRRGETVDIGNRHLTVSTP